MLSHTSLNLAIKKRIVRPIKALFFADKKAFFWLKAKLGWTEYQMAGLVWVKGLVIGLLFGWWLL